MGRAPLVLLAAGALLMLVAAVRLPSELRTRSSTTAPSKATEAGAQAPASGAVCVGSPCRANADAGAVRGYEVPSIAVDPAHPDHQVVGDVNLVGGRCGWHLTLDGGRSWADGVFDIPAGLSQCGLDTGGFMPMGNVAMGADPQHVYAVFGANREGRGEGILLATSADGGRTFGTAREAVPGGAAEESYRFPRLTVATDAQGADHLLVSAWGCDAKACTKGWFSRSDDGGATFSAPSLVTPDPGGNSPSPPVMAADDTVYMTFLRRFGQPEDNQPTELYLARSTDGGKTWENAQVDKQLGIGIQYDSAKIAIDPASQNIYLVWADTRAVRPEVFFRRSVDKGATFEKAIGLHTSRGGGAYSPVMAVGADGRIDVAFYREARRIPISGHQGSLPVVDVQATSSTDGGKTFGEDVKVNGRTIDRSVGYWEEVGDDSTPAVAATAGATYVAWSDPAEGNKDNDNQDTFVRRVDRAGGSSSS